MKLKSFWNQYKKVEKLSFLIEFNNFYFEESKKVSDKKQEKKIKIWKTKSNENLLSYNFVLVSRNKKIVIEATGLEATSSKKLILKFVDKFVDLEKMILINHREKAIATFAIQSWTKTVLKTQKFMIFK